MSVSIGSSPIHGKGVFAGKTIRKGEPIGRFEGRILREHEAPAHDPRIIWLKDQSQARPYPLYVTNDMYFLNHSSRPDAGFRGRDVFALRTIPRGEEILIDYWPRRRKGRLKRLRRLSRRYR